MYCVTPAEMLHVVLLKLCEYIADSIWLIFTVSTIYIIVHVVVGIYVYYSW